MYEKYCFLRAIQTKHTIHREGNERVQNVVLRSQSVKINLMRGKSIQKSDGSREEAVLESVGACPQSSVSFFLKEEGGRETVRGAWGP